MSPERPSTQRLTLILLVAVAVSGCGTTPLIIHVGAPFDRYDHNRLRPIVVQATPTGMAQPIDDRTYAPTGGDFPKANYASGKPADDGLSVANVVPIFTGVPLPLSSTPADGAPSDREDLVDYLAAGAMAQDGVTRRGMPGDTKEAAARYKVLLDLLASPTMVHDATEHIEQWAALRGISTSKRVLDSRYRMRAFKTNGVLALYCDGFWFVLYQMPAGQGFSRLVVVPISTPGQDFDAKTPAGKDGRCGGGQ